MPRGASPKREKALKELEQQLIQQNPHQDQQQGGYPDREHDDQADAAITGPATAAAAAPFERQVGRRGTGHMRRNTVRRARSS